MLDGSSQTYRDNSLETSKDTGLELDTKKVKCCSGVDKKS